MIDHRHKIKKLKAELTKTHNIGLRLGLLIKETPDRDYHWELDRFLSALSELRNLIDDSRDYFRSVDSALEWGLTVYKSNIDPGHKILWANSMADLGLLNDQELIKEQKKQC